MLTLEEWALIAEVVGALGVIISLVYLAVQLRLGRLASQAQLSYSSLEVYSRWRTALVDNSDLASAIAKVNAGETVDAREKIQLDGLMDELFYAAAISHSSTRESGALHARELDANYVVNVLTENPGLLTQWRRFEKVSKPGFAEFREVVSAKLGAMESQKRESAA